MLKNYLKKSLPKNLRLYFCNLKTHLHVINLKNLKTLIFNAFMKNKLYAIISGLLIAASTTSYGQEIVSEFNFRNGKMFSNTDIAECADGSLLTGVYYYDDYDYDDYGLLVCKTSRDGQLIDSARFNYGHLFSVNGAADTFIVTNFLWDDADQSDIFRMTFIDADLNVTETRSVPFLSGVDPLTRVIEDELIFTPEGDFVISYWTDVVDHNYYMKYGVFHMMRIHLDGTIADESETDRVLPPNWSTSHPADSALVYYSQGFGILEESPRVYYKLGGYIGTNNNHPWPLIAYSFDENLILTDTVVYKYIDENTFFDWAGHEHFVPFEKSASTDTYLMAAQMHHPDGTYRASLVKYDRDNNPLVIKSVESSSTVGSPIKTVTVDGNTVYHAYQIHKGYNSTAVGLVRLDNGLNTLWDITLTGGQSNHAYGQCLKTLHNGDIAIAFYTSFTNDSDQLHLYIIRDDYDAISEDRLSESPFVLYPNPVKGTLSLSFTEDNAPASVEIYDLTGQLMATKRDGLESIDMSAMPAGVYLLHVTTKDGTGYNERIVKE